MNLIKSILLFTCISFLLSCGGSASERAFVFEKEKGDSLAALKTSQGLSDTSENAKATSPPHPDNELRELWPIPVPSSIADLPRNLLTKNGQNCSLSDIDDRLSSALTAAGYDEKSYYQVPGGFALATHIEQIHADGTPAPPPDRWSLEFRPFASFSLKNYLEALLHAPVGHFRVILFVVSSEPIVPGGRIKEQEAVALLSNGADRLPQVYRTMSFSVNYACTVCIYEFKHTQALTKADFLNPGELSAITHLKQAGIWSAFPAK